MGAGAGGGPPKNLARIGSTRFDKKLEARAEHFGAGPAFLAAHKRQNEETGGDYQPMPQLIKEDGIAL